LATIYLDTSAVAKIYLNEAGSSSIREYVDASGEGNFLVLFALTEIEFRSLIRRKERAGGLDPETGNELIRRFEAHARSNYFTQPITNDILDHALHLLDRHPLKAFDALQLAGGLDLRRSSPREKIVFASADTRLLAAANAEGLQTFNPLEP